jgi:hypothetical protein
MTIVRRSRKTTAIALAAVLLTAPLLSGCSIISNFLPGGSNGGGLPGGVIPGQSIPSDFPGEVPLIEGDVLLGLSIPGDNGEKAWNVTIKASGIGDWDTIKGQFEDAGYEYQEFTAPTDKGANGAFTKDPYSAIVVLSSDKDEWTANYTVTNADTGQ